MSVAQELLPNFPSHLMNAGVDEEPSTSPPAELSSHQYQLALQQQAQQQLQQQLQRQLQLNLQSGSSSSRGSILPEPPDTTLNIDDDELRSRPPVMHHLHHQSSSSTTNRGSNSGGGASAGGVSGRSWTPSSVGGGLRNALNSAHLSALEALFRNPQGTNSTLQQRIGSSGSGGNTSNSSVDSEAGRNVSAVANRLFHSSSIASPSSVSVSNSHSGPLHRHHLHNSSAMASLSDNQPSMFDALGGAGNSDLSSGDRLSNVASSGDNMNQLVPGSGGNSNTGNGDGNNAASGANPPVLQAPAELSLLNKWLAESGIFVILLLLHFLYDHRLGMCIYGINFY